MNFTPKSHGGSIITGILNIAVVGLIGWDGHAAPAPAPITATQSAFAAQESFHASGPAPHAPAVQQAPAHGARTTQTHQGKSHWYKNKHWWKRNAPIIGGAGGGALIGGLAGGGTGALIGGAAGGGGGYVYKRWKRHHHR